MSQPLCKEILQILAKSLRNASIVKQITRKQVRTVYSLARKYFEEIKRAGKTNLEGLEILHGCLEVLRPVLAVRGEEVTEWLGGSLNSILRKVGLFLAGKADSESGHTLRLVLLSQL